MEERNLSVVLDEERDLHKPYLIILLLIGALVLICLLAWVFSMNASVPSQNVTEPIEPHMTPFSTAKNILGVK